LKLYVDVTIPRPTKDSSVKAGAARFTPLKAAAQAEYTKHAKYRDIAQANGYDMFAFALESYGGMGPDGSRLLRKLASFSRSFTPRQFLLHAYRRLSVTLQSSNANISLLAMQQLHLQQHARNRWTFDRQLSQQTRALGYAQPIDSDRLARELKPAWHALHEGAADSDGEGEQHAPACAFTFPHRHSYAGLTLDAPLPPARDAADPYDVSRPSADPAPQAAATAGAA